MYLFFQHLSVTMKAASKEDVCHDLDKHARCMKNQVVMTTSLKSAYSEMYKLSLANDFIIDVLNL